MIQWRKWKSIELQFAKTRSAIAEHSFLFSPSRNYKSRSLVCTFCHSTWKVRNCRDTLTLILNLAPRAWRKPRNFYVNRSARELKWASRGRLERSKIISVPVYDFSLISKLCCDHKKIHEISESHNERTSINDDQVSSLNSRLAPESQFKCILPLSFQDHWPHSRLHK